MKEQEKNCKQCNKLFIARRRDGCDLKKVNFCGRRCSFIYSHNNTIPKEVYCVECNTRFLRIYNQKKYCDNCHKGARKSIIEYKKRYNEINKDRLNRLAKQYRTSPETRLIYLAKKKAIYIKDRIKALTFYGNNPPKCICCNETEIKFLVLDHINNDGKIHRLEIKERNIYQWLKSKKYPVELKERLQVLCHNCNMAKQFYGKCPHIVNKPQ